MTFVLLCLLALSDGSNSELWLGGKYDWQHKNWLWGYNGRKMKYQAFGKHQEQQQKNR